ncbi:MAG: hypothetical protein DRI61_14390, partial [Chloroflexi bacterium]
QRGGRRTRDGRTPFIAQEKLAAWFGMPQPHISRMPPQKIIHSFLLRFIQEAEGENYHIFVGILMAVVVWWILHRTRLGMIIRAGVEDREMVEALGINVQRVFTLVFVMGAALAALGGITAAPFLRIDPDMGLAFQLYAFIAVVIGGMGSYILFGRKE